MTDKDLTFLRAVDHTQTPWRWIIHDHSMASIEGPDGEEQHVLSVSPCKNCQKGKTDWEWGRCCCPKEADADFIIRAANSHRALLAALQLLYAETAEYARINNLGGLHNHAMQVAREALELVSKK